MINLIILVGVFEGLDMYGFSTKVGLFTCEYAVVILGSCKRSRFILHIYGMRLIPHLVSEILHTYVGQHVK